MTANVTALASASATGGVRLDSVDVEPVETAGALWLRYPGQSAPQPVYVTLDPTRRELSVAPSGEIGPAVPMPVWHGRTLRWGIQPLRQDAANDLLERLRPLAERVCAGYSERWDGSNHRGHLDADASAAEREIGDLCDEASADPDALLRAWELGDWLCPEGRRGWPFLAKEIGLSAWTDDAGCEALANRWADEALAAPGVDVLVGDSVRWVLAVRDALRDEVDDDRGTDGVLCRYEDGAELGPATDAQANASAAAGPEGVILVDLATGEVVEAQDAKAGAVRCYVEVAR